MAIISTVGGYGPGFQQIRMEVAHLGMLVAMQPPLVAWFSWRVLVVAGRLEGSRRPVRLEGDASLDLDDTINGE